MDVHRAAALAGLILLAGCIAGGSAPTAPPDAAWAAEGDVAVRDLAERHWQVLLDAGSFTANRSSRVLVDGDPEPVGPTPEWYHTPAFTRVEVDLDDGRYHRRSVRVRGHVAETFISPGVDASRRKPCTVGDCGWGYDYNVRPETDTLAGEIDRYRRRDVVDTTVTIMDDWNYTFSDAGRRDGRTLYRYDASWTPDRPMHPFDAPPNGTGTLVVTADGVIHRWSYRFTGPATVRRNGATRSVTVTLGYRVTYTRIGDTRVDRPGWVDVARGRHRDRRTRTGQA